MIANLAATRMRPDAARWRRRQGPDGVHLFRRSDGVNVLLDITSPPETWSVAPRQVSIALTNACDLRCAYCYAPKQSAMLDAGMLLRWLRELDTVGAFAVGFGGGEPTLHPTFAEICRETAQTTGLAVTFTTHAHHISADLCREIAGSVHFVRVSMDGVGATYERLRGRSHKALLERINMLASVAPVGINTVVNSDTIGELDDVVAAAIGVGATELLLLPERAVGARSGIDRDTEGALRGWVQQYRGPIRLVVSEAGSGDLPVVNPLPRESGLQSFAHIDATGTLRSSSFATEGVRIDAGGVANALQRLEQILERGRE